ncbi:MAG: hypothetical protein EP343_10490 [Deltaproteobacteria bacterium]|nr:MAG: hypothetical protein EP343_10490 [Deltaproteobacteria bacterium]
MQGRLGWNRKGWFGAWCLLFLLLLWGAIGLSCSQGPADEPGPTENAVQETAPVEANSEPQNEQATESTPEPGKEAGPEASKEPSQEPAEEPVVESSTESSDEAATDQVDAGSPVEDGPEGPDGDCFTGDVRPCYAGTASTRGKGACRDGQQVCNQGAWGPCLNSVLPQTETCDGKDNNCDGVVDETCCSALQLVSTTFASRAEVADIAFTPNGQNMAVAYSDEYVRVWRLSDRRLLYRYLFVSGKPARSVDFSVDNKSLISSSEGDYFRLRELGASSNKYTFNGHTSNITKVRFSPDGKYIASAGSDGTVRLWNVSNGQQAKVWTEHAGPVSSVSFSPDNKYVVSASDDKTLKVWSVSSDKSVRTLKGHTDYVTDVSYSPDGTLIASSSFDKDIRLWSAKDGTLVRTIKGHKSFVLGLSFRPDSKALTSIGFKERPHLWQVSDGKLLRQLSLFGSGVDVSVIRFHPQSRMVASGGKDGKVRLWDINRDKLLQEGFGPEIVDIDVHPKQPWVALARGNKFVDIYNLNTGAFVQSLQGHVNYVRSLFFSKDGSYLISGDYSGRLRWWSTQNWSLVRQEIIPSSRAIRWLEPSPDGKTFSSVSDDRRTRIWDIAKGTILQTLGSTNTARTTTIYSTAYHHNNDWIATGASSSDPVIWIWSRKTNKVVKYLQGHRSSVYSLSFKPNSDILASAGSSDRTVRLWNVATGRSMGVLMTGNVGENIWSVKFSPNGKYLAAYAEYGTVYVWETQNYKSVGTLKFPSEYALSLKWSKDSQFLLAGTREGYLRRWKVSSSACTP